MANDIRDTAPSSIADWVGQWRITGDPDQNIVHIELDSNDPSGLSVHYSRADNHMTNLSLYGKEPQILAGDIMTGANGAVWASFMWFRSVDAQTGLKFVNGCWWFVDQAGSYNWDLQPIT